MEENQSPDSQNTGKVNEIVPVADCLSSTFLELISTIGLPGIVEGARRKSRKELIQLAELNKVALLYSLASGHDANDLMARHRLLIETLRQVSALFNSSGIKYSVFKTIKPFRSTPSDIDILVSSEDLSEAVELLTAFGYSRTAYDAFSATLQKEMIIDLQLQPSVSNLPYLSKQFLMENTILDDIDGVSIYRLNKTAEIIVIACHSLYKEQMFTLNDYYTITMLAELVDAKDLLKSAELSNSIEALKIVLPICARITESGFGIRLRVSDICDILGVTCNNYPLRNLQIKFSLPLVIKLLVGRASRDDEMRRKMIPAIIRIASPKQFIKLMTHLRRKTY